MIAFWVIDALLAAGALLFVLPPLILRHERIRASRRDTNLSVYRDQLRELEADLAAGTLSTEQHEKARRELEARLLADVALDDAAVAPVSHARGAATVVGVAVPLLAFALYFAVGNPQALFAGPAAGVAAAHDTNAQQVEALLERLAARMRENPADPEGWMLLGRSYGALGRFDQAAQAYANAAARLPRDAGLLADYADMLAMAQGQRLQGEPERIIARALEADPNNLKALAMAGAAAFERQDYAGAVRHWERMLPLVPPDSESARAIQGSIAEARSLGGAVRAEPPKALGDLKLLHALQGKQALQEINRLHGKEIGGKKGYVAHYEKDGDVAMLYLAQASSTAQAARQLTLMSDRIQRGDSPFHHLKTSKRGEITLYSALGQGQVHYFFQRDSSVLWLAVDAPAAMQALAALLEGPKAVKE